jgi:hypothetical protein
MYCQWRLKQCCTNSKSCLQSFKISKWYPIRILEYSSYGSNVGLWLKLICTKMEIGKYTIYTLHFIFNFRTIVFGKVNINTTMLVQKDLIHFLKCLSSYWYAINKMDCPFLVGHIYIRDKIIKLVKKGTQTIWFHQVMLILWQHFHLLFFFAMSIIVLRVSISCKDILYSYNK